MLRLDPTNKTALYRRSKALSKPINSGVDDLKAAVKDLKAINSNEMRVVKRITKLEKKIKQFSKDEHETYSKMFNRTEKEKSVSEFVEEKKVVIEPVKSTLEKEVDDDLAKVDAEVARMLEKKLGEANFEVKPESEWQDAPEFKQLQIIIDKAIENMRLSKKLGKHREYDLLKDRCKEVKFCRAHFLQTFNMDLTRPTQAMKDKAAKHNIDLKDPQVIDEFKCMQMQNLEDIRRLRDGKQHLSEQDFK